MFAEWDKAVDRGWPSIYLGNHDQPRMISRFGSDDPRFRSISAKMLATFLLTMRGTPYWFAGDEIGMCNICFENIDDYNDIDTKTDIRKLKRKVEIHRPSWKNRNKSAVITPVPRSSGINQKMPDSPLENPG